MTWLALVPLAVYINRGQSVSPVPFMSIINLLCSRLSSLFGVTNCGKVIRFFASYPPFCCLTFSCSLHSLARPLLPDLSILT